MGDRFSALTLTLGTTPTQAGLYAVLTAALLAIRVLERASPRPVGVRAFALAHRWWLVVALCLLAFLVAPFRASFADFLYMRPLPYALAMIAVLVAPRRLPPLVLAPLAMLLALALGETGLLSFDIADRYAAAIREIDAQIEPRSTVWAATPNGMVEPGLDALVVSERGGRSLGGFAALSPISPVRVADRAARRLRSSSISDVDLRLWRYLVVEIGDAPPPTYNLVTRNIVAPPLALYESVLPQEPIDAPDREVAR
jgi:hypothetical protein